MAKSRKQQELDSTQERSIGTFQTTVDNFSKVAERLADSFDGFAKTQELDRKAKKKVEGEKKKESADQKKISKAMDSANNLFGKKTMSVAGKVMGKENFNGFKKGLAGMKSGKSFGGGMMGKAAAGLGSAGGAILRAAGPVGAVISGLKMAYDFWNSGGLAKLIAGVKMATGKAGNMMGPDGVASTMANLEGTEEFRKIDAKYAYQKPLELQQQLEQDIFNNSKSIAMDKLNFQQSLVKDEVEYEMGLRKDALQFQLDQAKETLDAELEKRKAIAGSGISFIEKYATISERALKAIGSGTKQILEGIGKFTATFGLGIKQSFQLSENAQGLAYHLSGSDEDVMNMTKLFSLMGKTSAETAQNLIAGFESFAKINDIAPQVIFNQIKEAGEDIYKFSNGTADSFAKQAVLLSKMSVSMSSMMKASDTMVLNYKDSIKAEMSLSAMLGKNVNLSEVRAKLMAGDQAGGAAALKSALGGMDIGAMNPFAKQQLTQATGMDISALMALMQGKEGEVSGELKAEAAKGKAFADAALKQDLANAGAKLALEQEQRKKLLAFEQRQRLSMMLLEQAQKMDQIKLEAAYRAEWEIKYAKMNEKELAAAAANAEAASGLLASKGTRTMMEQAFASYGLSAGTGATADTTGVLMGLLEEGRIESADFGKLTLAFDAALEKNKVDLKDTAAVEATLKQVTQSTFGTQIAQKNKDTELQLKRIENIAYAYNKDGFESWKEGNKVTDEELKLAMSIMSTETRQMATGQYTTTAVTKYTGLDPKKLEELKKANLDGTSTVVAATQKGNTSLKTVEGNGQQQIDNQIKTTVVQTKTLSEYEYSTKLQQEMVNLLGIAGQFLQQISANTVQDSDININGKVLAKSLLNQAKTSYAVNRVETIS